MKLSLLQQRAVKKWRQLIASKKGASQSTETIALTIGILVVVAAIIAFVVIMFKSDILPTIQKTIENLFNF